VVNRLLGGGLGLRARGTSTSDQASGRIPNPTVRTELVLRAARRSKREAAFALRHGDVEAATRVYDEPGHGLKAFAAEAALA
jgi:Ca-activated chloride channel family protein